MPPLTDTLKNLVLVPDVEHHPLDDFQKIAELIRQRAPDIRPLVLDWNSWRKQHLQRWLLGMRPTLVVGLRDFGPRLRPWRGTAHQGAALAKSQTYERMRLAGLPVIPWCPWTATTTIDPAWMGSFVISKPDIGARGRDVKIRSVTRLAFDAGRRGKEAWILQKFIHTGPHPVSHRVLTLYGQPLMHLRHENPQAQPCHDPEDGRQVAGHNPVASHRDARVTMAEDADIEALASAVAMRGFPDIPVLGIDIVRAAADGSLHVCEINAYGQTWHFSSQRGQVMQQARELDLYAQKNALDTAADLLVAACRSHAR